MLIFTINTQFSLFYQQKPSYKNILNILNVLNIL